MTVRLFHLRVHTGREVRVHSLSLNPGQPTRAKLKHTCTMPGHRRVKDVGYDDDDIDDYYSDEEGEYAAGGGGGDEYTAEEKENFATLTPVVKAELQEAGLQASDREVEDALWNYYWDVGKSVNYLKNAKQPKSQPVKAAPKEKAKSKFDEAQERSAAKTGGEWFPCHTASREWLRIINWTYMKRRAWQYMAGD